jgi:hypothetical protein
MRIARKPLRLLALTLGLAAAGCGAAQNEALPSPSATLPVASPLSPSPSANPTLEPTPSPSPSSEPLFEGTSAKIDDATRARMAFSWRPGCPVPIQDLRLLTMDYWGFDGDVHVGEMVVNKSVAAGVLQVFGVLFGARFPIKMMRLVDAYQADDDLSMAANNTSAFNCRAVTGGTAWSEHSYGWAIDINPIQNPYVASDGSVLPPQGVRFADRSLDEKGMIHAGDGVVSAFASIGWGWGGSWHSFQDYQHFSATGE